MPVAFESAQSNYVTSSAQTTVVVTAPANIADGDLLLAYSGSDPLRTVSAPNGWTLIHENDYSTVHRQCVWFKKAASESGDYTFTTGGTYSSLSVSIARFTGAQCESASDFTHATASTASYVNTMTCANIDTAVNNSLIWWGGVGGNGSASSASRGTERVDVAVGSYNRAVCAFIESVASAGTQSGSVVTRDNYSTGNMTLSLVIQPAAAASTPLPLFMQMYHRG